MLLATVLARQLAFDSSRRIPDFGLFTSEWLAECACFHSLEFHAELRADIRHLARIQHPPPPLTRSRLATALLATRVSLLDASRYAIRD